MSAFLFAASVGEAGGKAFTITPFESESSVTSDGVRSDGVRSDGGKAEEGGGVTGPSKRPVESEDTGWLAPAECSGSNC